MASNRGGKSPITLHFKAVGSDYDLSQTDKQNDGSRSDDVPKTLDKEKALSESPGSDLASSASLIVFVDDLQADETDSQEAPQDDETSAGDPLGDDAEHVDQFDDLHARLLDLETSIEGLQEHIMQMKSESIEANRKNEMLAAFTRAHHCALAPVMELEFLRSIQQLMNDATVKRDWGLENPDECLEAYIEQSAAARPELGGHLTRSTAPDAGEQDLETRLRLKEIEIASLAAHLSLYSEMPESPYRHMLGIYRSMFEWAYDVPVEVYVAECAL